MNKIVKSLRYTILFILLFVSCGYKEDAVTILSRDEVRQIYPARVEASKNSLTIHLNILDITSSSAGSGSEFAPYHMALQVTFKNITSQTLFFKKPRSTGFNNITSIRDFPVVFNDVGLIISTKDEVPIEYNPSSQFHLTPFPSYNIIDSYSYHRQEDFIELDANKTYSYIVNLQIPVVYFGDSPGEKIPSGDYRLYAVYGNEAIGYHNIKDQRDVSTPTSQGGLEIVDLHAWVGNIKSNTVEFSIPE
jgi:hypothetical protein